MSIKRIITAGLCALAMMTGAAYAQSGYPDSHSSYDSQSAEGNSARWGVGG